MPANERSAVEARVTRFLEGSGPLPELISARPLYDQIEQIKKENKALRFKLQAEQDLPEDVTFAQYHRANYFDAAWLLIHRPRHSGQRQTLPTLGHPEAKFEAWKASRKIPSLHRLRGIPHLQPLRCGKESKCASRWKLAARRGAIVFSPRCRRNRLVGNRLYETGVRRLVVTE